MSWDLTTLEELRHYYDSTGDYRDPKGKRTKFRLNILKRVTRQVINERPELRNQKGQLCSAVFAKLKQDGYFRYLTTFKKIPLTENYLHERYATMVTSVAVLKMWNEKEFFYWHRWAKNDIVNFSKPTLPFWIWILLGVGGLVISQKLLK